MSITFAQFTFDLDWRKTHRSLNHEDARMCQDFVLPREEDGEGGDAGEGAGGGGGGEQGGRPQQPSPPWLGKARQGWRSHLEAALQARIGQ